MTEDGKMFGKNKLPDQNHILFFLYVEGEQYYESIQVEFAGQTEEETSMGGASVSMHTNTLENSQPSISMLTASYEVSNESTLLDIANSDSYLIESDAEGRSS